MKSDPIVQQVRDIRRQIEEENGRDPDAYYQYLQKLQKGLTNRLVCREPKPLSTATKKGVAR